MFRRMVTRIRILALAGLGVLLAAGPVKAQQGWPIVGSNWDITGGSSRGGSSWSSSHSYSPSYYNPSYTSPSTYAAYPRSFGNSSPYYYGSVSSEGYYSTSTSESAKRHVRINLRVPSDAKIWFGASQTKQTGTARSFESPPLDVGHEYTYQIRVQWIQDGKDVVQTRQVQVHAGDVINLTMGSPS